MTQWSLWDIWVCSEKLQGEEDSNSFEGQPESLDIGDAACWVVTVPALIALKRAAGRGKDREALAELEALLEERDRRPSDS